MNKIKILFFFLLWTTLLYAQDKSKNSHKKISILKDFNDTKFIYNDTELKSKEKIDVSEIESIEVVTGLKAKLLYGNNKTYIIKGQKKQALPFLVSITPSKLKKEVYITFTLDKPSNIRIQIYNSNNELMTTLIDKSLSPASYNYNWKPSKTVPKGEYTILINRDLEVYTRTIVKQ